VCKRLLADAGNVPQLARKSKAVTSKMPHASDRAPSRGDGAALQHPQPFAVMRPFEIEGGAEGALRLFSEGHELGSQRRENAAPMHVVVGDRVFTGATRVEQPHPVFLADGLLDDLSVDGETHVIGRDEPLDDALAKPPRAIDDDLACAPPSSGGA
jgi:hypothetical protein